MSEKLSKNLNLLMAEVRLNAEELSRRIGVPASTIKKIRNNNDSNPTLSTLVPIAQYFSLTISQLIGDEFLPATRIKGSYRVHSEMLTHVPVISWVEAIAWPHICSQTSQVITSEHTYSEKAFALLVEEDNWENLSKNTALLVDPVLKAEHRDFVIVHKIDQKTPSLKQTLYDEGQIYLKPIMQGYNVIALTPDHKILGVVVEYKKHLKKYD